jgi:hypothetical protein
MGVDDAARTSNIRVIHGKHLAYKFVVDKKLRK